MNLKITFPPELRAEMEKVIVMEQDSFWRAGNGISKMVSAKLQKQFGFGLKFDYKFENDTTLLLAIRTGTYTYDSWMLKHFKKYESADGRIHVEELVSSADS